jgi:hypothetical protein
MQMKEKAVKCRLFRLLACISIFASCMYATSITTPLFAEQVAQSSSPAEVKKKAKNGLKFRISSEYKRLAFRGFAERIDLGDDYEFLVKLELKYLASSGRPLVDFTQFENVKNCEFKVTQKATQTSQEDINQPSTELYRDSFPLVNQFVRKGEPTRLPDIKFRVSKATYANATNINLSLSDGNTTWPLTVELKPK